MLDLFISPLLKFPSLFHIMGLVKGACNGFSHSVIDYAVCLHPKCCITCLQNRMAILAPYERDLQIVKFMCLLQTYITFLHVHLKYLKWNNIQSSRPGWWMEKSPLTFCNNFLHLHDGLLKLSNLHLDWIDSHGFLSRKREGGKYNLAGLWWSTNSCHITATPIRAHHLNTPW